MKKLAIVCCLLVLGLQGHGYGVRPVDPPQKQTLTIPYFNPYVYEASVVRVYDADTLTLQVDLGFKVQITETFRLNRINAWEVRGEEKVEGLKARDRLRTLLSAVEYVTIKTEKDKKGKYGRYLCELLIVQNGKYVNLNDLLVKENHARYQSY